ncbi:MAG TPA: hypothetical protein V6C52_09335 [Coleofasciculaceae cyanobacterium]|jgi:hypothetical protein
MRIEALEANLGASGAMPQTGAMQQWKDYPVLMEAISMTMINTVSATEPGQKSPSGKPIVHGPDLHDILEKVDLPQNKFWVLRLMGRADWIRILNMLPKKMLVNALNLFDKDKLMRFILWLPSEYLLKVILRMFSIEQLVLKMPTRELMRILRSPRLSNRELIKGLRRMNPAYLLLLLNRIYGDCQFDKMKDSEIWQWIMRTNKMRLMEAFKTMPFKALVPMVIELLKRDPELLLLLSEDFFFRQLDRMPKGALVEACSVLPEALLINMLMNLPDASMLEAVAQIDDKTLSDYLLFSQTNLLYSLGSAA